MAENQVQRRLAAILVADAVAYSQLMGRDEEGTLSALTAHRTELIEPCIAENRGHLVKTTGDGLLAEFASVVDAVRCAVAIQNGMRDRNEGAAEGERIAFRIGVNLGDVIFQDGDVFGDGVNVAARLEGLAKPGGICISDMVKQGIRSKLDLPLDDLGLQHVKNIDQPVRVYSVVLPSETTRSGPAAVSRAHFSRRGIGATAAVLAIVLATVVVAAAWWWPPWSQPQGVPQENSADASEPEKPSVGVLPFADLSEDKDQSYLSDGLAEDLITDLSRISGLSVIARTSTFAYRGKAQDVRDIGADLNARYIVDGSVRKLGDNIRVVAQLVDAQSGENIWAERFDRPASDLFDLQEDLRGRIILALKVKLSSREEEWLSRRSTSSPEAYDLYLRGLQQMSFFSHKGNDAARTYFERAIEIDPGFAAAYAQLAQVYSLAWENGWVGETSDYQAKALALAQKAVELDDQLPQAYWSLGRIYSRPPHRDSERAREALERAVALDPNFADGFAFLASVLNASGEAEKALGAIERAMQTNPNFPFWYTFELGRSQFFLTRFEFAAENFRKAIERNPTVQWPHRWLASAYGHLGALDDAEWEIAELESLGAPLTVTQASDLTTIRDPAYKRLFLDGLRKAGVPEG